jgi:pimeloyl-ACP methyl ester carboxylesterase
VIHGEQDEYGSTQHAKIICALSAGPSQLDLLANAGHVPHREQADLIVRRIASFLAGSA